MNAGSLGAIALVASACSGTQDGRGSATTPATVVTLLETALPASAEMDRCRADHENRLGGKACVRVVLDNAMPDSFVLKEARLAIDGKALRDLTEIADVADPTSQVRQVTVFAGPVDAGSHEIEVWLRHRGHGHGVFSYMKKYTFPVGSKHGFTLARGESLDLRVVAYDKGGPTTPLEERPAVLYQERRR